MQVDWRSAPAVIKSLRLRAYPDAPWQTVIQDAKVDAGNFSTSILNFGQRFNVHQAEIGMMGSHSAENASIARVVLVDNNPSSHGFGPGSDDAAKGQDVADADTSAAQNEGGLLPHAGQATPTNTANVPVEVDNSGQTGKIISILYQIMQFFHDSLQHCS
jgi:hypothetical protein